jgi:hypothetical protein
MGVGEVGAMVICRWAKYDGRWSLAVGRKTKDERRATVGTMAYKLLHLPWHACSQVDFILKYVKNIRKVVSEISFPGVPRWMQQPEYNASNRGTLFLILFSQSHQKGSPGSSGAPF